MFDNEIEITSLCYIAEDYDGRVWLYRLADVEGDTLCLPYKSDRPDNYFENRDRLYRNDGPADLNSVGIWRWTAIPNRDNPSIDYVQSFYISEASPVRVVVSQNIQSINELLDLLKNGNVRTRPYICDTLFCYQSQWGEFTGILCKANEFTVTDKYAKLNDSVYSLPYYVVKASDIYNWDDKHLRFLKKLNLSTPAGILSVGNIHEIICQIMLNRLTWPLYKECIAGTKAEWRVCKTMLERICGESLYEEVAEKLKCSAEQAKLSVEEFVERADTLIDAGDIDSDILAQVALHHTGLKAQCEAVVEENWKLTHASEISAAEAEVNQIRKEAESDVQKATQQLHSLTQEKRTVEEEKSALLAEIAASQQKLDGLLKEIEQYEALGNDTVQAVRAKIGEAQKDMAGFIAELSMFMPQTKADVEVPHESRVPNHWRFIEGLSHTEDQEFNKDDIEECSGWEDTLDILKSNLQLAGVGEQWVSYLSAVLYSAYINKVHLLLAGPNAKNIADAVSMAITGCGISAIECYGEKEQNAILAAYAAKYPLIAIENPFHPDWISCMPYINYGVCDTEKTMLWLHPFAEDLAIEPCGLYNYVLPIFTECFVEQKASWRVMTAGIPQDGYETYHSSEKTFVQMRHIKKLGISKLVTNRIQTLLNAAKDMSGISDSDMEYLFALLPFSVLNGKQHILKETLENEKSISSAVKAEVMRYIEEE